MSKLQTLERVAKAFAERKAYLPSEQWENMKREGAVIEATEVDALIKAFREAPEARIGAALSGIKEILSGFLK